MPKAAGVIVVRPMAAEMTVNARNIIFIAYPLSPTKQPLAPAQSSMAALHLTATLEVYPLSRAEHATREPRVCSGVNCARGSDALGNLLPLLPKLLRRRD